MFSWLSGLLRRVSARVRGDAAHSPGDATLVRRVCAYLAGRSDFFGTGVSRFGEIR
jgi:hypothetical protein